jgi:hypothetical protein
MARRILLGLLPVTLLFATLATPAAQADIVLYQIPLIDPPLVMILQGSTKALPGSRTISYRHRKFGQVLLDLEDCRISTSPTVEELLLRELNRAVATKDVKAIMSAGQKNLKRGQIDEFYRAAEEALNLEPDHAAARRAIELRTRMAQPMGDSSEEEKKLRDVIKKPGMKIIQSAHYILLHDTPDKGKRQKRTRAEERLELLERVYEVFMLTFYSKGVEIEIPNRRMMVVLFQERDDFRNYSKRLAGDLQSTAGFWHQDSNLAVFYDQGTNDDLKMLKELADKLEKQKEEFVSRRLQGAKEVRRIAETMTLMSEIAQENSDIEVVSHEATHQLAGNTGLLPRQVLIPSWVHEGLASYFEAPNDATWGGIGAVNSQRLSWYRALKDDRKHSNIDFIVGDQIFSYAGSLGAKMHGYGQAWALTHFLVERHFDKFMAYYQRLGEMPPDVHLSPALLTSLFSEVFGDDHHGLESEWRSYMRGLKTSKEELLDGF